MDAILASIHALSAPGECDKLHTQLKGTAESEVLRNEAMNRTLLQHIAAALNLQQHSLGVLHLLVVQGSLLNEQDHGQFFVVCSTFLQTCDAAQIQIASKQFVELCVKYTEIVTKLNAAIQGIKPLTAAIEKLLDGKVKRTLTPMHADLLQLCLLSGCYHKGDQVIRSFPVYEVEPKVTHLKEVDFLRYWYYGGNVYVGLKNFPKAIECYRLAIATPASSLSAVVVESYKKMVLISLIETGEMPVLPPYTSNPVSRALKGVTKSYQTLGQLFTDNNREGLEEEMNKSFDEFDGDSNMGLAKQLLEALTSRRIQRLTHTYITLSLTDIAQNVGLAGPAEAEARLVGMIDKGRIFARIDQTTGMVRFEDNDDDCNSVAMMQRLEAEMGMVVGLSKRVEALDLEVSKNPVYLNKLNSQSRGGASGGGVDMAEEIAMQESLNMTLA